MNQLNGRQTSGTSIIQYVLKNKILYIMLIPGIMNLLIFKYWPMYGVVIAFQNYTPRLGYFHSQWVGLLHFRSFFNDPFCWRLIRNTFILGLYSLTFGFPAPIILALMLNEMKQLRLKKVIQTISYMPYFLSVVIVVGIMNDIFATVDGPVNKFLLTTNLIDDNISFIKSAQWFRSLYIGSGIWQGIGFSSIIYLAAISGVNPELYESAIIDGANRMQRILHITLPGIRPTIIILFIMAVGGILGNDMQKILLMYGPQCYSTADVISTYVYRMGIEGSNFSYSTAVGMLSNIVGVAFLLVTNFVFNKFSETSLI